jgi:hypothetical protein
MRKQLSSHVIGVMDLRLPEYQLVVQQCCLHKNGLSRNTTAAGTEAIYQCKQAMASWSATLQRLERNQR